MIDDREILETIQLQPNGITLENLAKKIPNSSYWTLRKPCIALVEQGLLDSSSRQGRKTVYKIPVLGTSPTVPNTDPGKAPITLVTLLTALAAKTPNEQQHIILIKRLGKQIAQLAKIAHLWHIDEYVDDDEVSALRNEMEEASYRAYWVYKVYQVILKNDKLWHTVDAWPEWYNDRYNPFTIEQLEYLTNLLRGQEYYEG